MALGVMLRALQGSLGYADRFTTSWATSSWRGNGDHSAVLFAIKRRRTPNDHAHASLASAMPTSGSVTSRCAIFETTLGPDHPTVANSLSSLALVLYATNRHAEAEPLMRRALAINAKGLGQEHPSVAANLGNLADAHHRHHPVAWDTNTLLKVPSGPEEVTLVDRGVEKRHDEENHDEREPQQTHRLQPGM